MDNITETTATETFSETIPEAVKPKLKRGFASMSPEKVAEIARSGGKAAHAKGAAHQFTPEEARAAGSKGGRAAHKSRGRTKVAPISGT